MTSCDIIYIYTNIRGFTMTYSYNKLWKLLIDNNMKKKDLMERANLTSTTIAKMGKSEPVSLEALARICVALHCNIGDIIEILIDA